MAESHWSGTLVDWEHELADLKARLRSALGRSEIRQSAGAFIDGLLSGAERKTGWMIAEEAGLSRPYRIQSLLGRSSWSANDLGQEVRAYALDSLADADGVLVVDETGFLKKGRHSVGVGRQYSGTAGRIENCQVGVFACYASRWGQTLIDRRLYLPKDWAADPERRTRTSIPDDIDFATKPIIARDMVEHLLDEGIPCAWVLADAVYGSATSFRRMLERRGQPYVLSVRSNHTLRFLKEWQLIHTDPATIAAELTDQDWRALSAGEGAKGPRLYHWARVPLSWETEAGFQRWLLIRRSVKDSEALAYSFAYAKTDTSLAELAAAAGLRWTIEECFLRAKDDLGLDHCEARSWHAWHRHMSLVMAAAAFLAKLAADQRRAAWAQWSGKDPGKRDKTSPKQSRHRTANAA